MKKRYAALVITGLVASCFIVANGPSNVGGGWYVRGVSLPEAGRQYKELYRGTRFWHAKVDDEVLRYELYPPDCIGYERLHATRLICGEHQGIQLTNADHLEVEAAGVRYWNPVFDSSRNTWVVSEMLVPVDSLRAAGNAQPVRSGGLWGWTGATLPAVPASVRTCGSDPNKPPPRSC